MQVTYMLYVCILYMWYMCKLLYTCVPCILAVEMCVFYKKVLCVHCVAYIASPDLSRNISTLLQQMKGGDICGIPVCY